MRTTIASCTKHANGAAQTVRGASAPAQTVGQQFRTLGGDKPRHQLSTPPHILAADACCGATTRQEANSMHLAPAMQLQLRRHHHEAHLHGLARTQLRTTAAEPSEAHSRALNCLRNTPQPEIARAAIIAATHEMQATDRQTKRASGSFAAHESAKAAVLLSSATLQRNPQKGPHNSPAQRTVQLTALSAVQVRSVHVCRCMHNGTCPCMPLQHSHMHMSGFEPVSWKHTAEAGTPHDGHAINITITRGHVTPQGVHRESMCATDTTNHPIPQYSTRKAPRSGQLKLRMPQAVTPASNLTTSQSSGGAALRRASCSKSFQWLSPPGPLSQQQYTGHSSSR
jgi:hypothetical protein